MIRRYRDIINILLNIDGCVTGIELARKCDVSLSTIRTDIKEINNELEEYNIKIDSIIKKGYCLTDKSKNILKENNIIRSVMDYEYIAEMPNTPIERQMYILLKLTMEDYIDVENLLDRLYISTSTLNNDIISAKRWLKENLDLNLNYSLTKGIRLNCNENDKRNIISWIIAKKSNASTVTKYWNYLFGNKEILKHTDKLFPIVNKETKKFGYILSGHSSQLLCNEIIVASNRCELGFNLEENNQVSEALLPVIIAIRQRIETELMIILPDIEWLTLQHYFKSRQYIRGSNIKNIITDEAAYIVTQFIKNVNEKFNIDLDISYELKENLLLYVAPMINRLKSKYSIANMIDENIIEAYPLEFQMASEMINVIKNRLGINIPLIELAYITIHLVSTKKAWNKKLNGIIVSDFDESIINFIKNKIFQNLNENIRFCGLFTYQEFIFGLIEDLEKVDFIITTATLADKTDIPLINISPTLEQKDIQNLCERIEQLNIFN